MFGSERTTRLSCDWRSFTQAAKSGPEGVGIFIRGNCSDAEAKDDQDKEPKFFHVGFLLLTGTLRELASEGTSKASWKNHRGEAP